MKKFIIIALITVIPTLVMAYDAVFTFTQSTPELVAGWKIKAGPTKGGPYPYVVDCKKPVANPDGSYDCTGTGLTANPLYAVAVNYDSTGKESVNSNEASLSITVQPPANLKAAIKITTVSKLTNRGNIIATTTVKRIELDATIKEGTTGYRNKRGEWVSNTVVALN